VNPCRRARLRPQGGTANALLGRAEKLRAGLEKQIFEQADHVKVKRMTGSEYIPEGRGRGRDGGHKKNKGRGQDDGDTTRQTHGGISLRHFFLGVGTEHTFFLRKASSAAHEEGGL